LVAFNKYSFQTFGWIGVAGILSGLTAMLYILCLDFFSSIFTKIQYQPLRTLIGGVILVAIIILTHQEKMTGLGLQNIADAFIHPQGHWDFLIKLLLTSITLSVGFKGGEVTPLFFIGAVLGSVLVAFIPLPISLVAGLGLIAVFAGATHCLISSVILGIELFGIQYSCYIIIACTIAYLFSGKKNIYTGRPKGWLKEKIAAYFL
jgi:H+/Cl- antiporter ClcA